MSTNKPRAVTMVPGGMALVSGFLWSANIHIRNVWAGGRLATVKSDTAAKLAKASPRKP